MGCASSKQSSRCKHCQAPYSPVTRRSFSMNVHHPPSKKGDTYHVVALTSSTLGSIKLDPPPNQNPPNGGFVDRKNRVGDHCEDDDQKHHDHHHHHVGIAKKDEFAMGMIEAKAWSKMIDEKITKRVAPKTPVRTPPGEPETIDVKDLMEGLEDNSPLRHVDYLRSFSFHVAPDSIPPFESPKTRLPPPNPQEQQGFDSTTHRTWFDAAEKENVSNGDLVSKALVSDFDPEVISAFRKALEELSPTNPYHLKPRDQVAKNGVLEEHNVNGVTTFEAIEKKLNGITRNELTEEDHKVGIKEDVTKENGVVANNIGHAYVNGFPKQIGVVANTNGHAYVNGYPQETGVNGDVASNGHVHINGFQEKNGVVANNVHIHVHGCNDIKVNLSENGFANGNCYLEKGRTEEKKKNNNKIVVENGDVHKEKERLVLYFTSLRGVRKTYEDCCYVRLILKGVGVRVDERDVSMHSGFKEELRELLGEGLKGGLPKVFVGEKYIGGVEEIRRMHEEGKLEKVLEGCERLEDDGGNLIDVCEACGDIRFVPCETCSGSCKIYYECEDDNDEYEEDEYGFQRCPDCNENGLVRCPICCY